MENLIPLVVLVLKEREFRPLLKRFKVNQVDLFAAYEVFKAQTSISEAIKKPSVALVLLKFQPLLVALNEKLTNGEAIMVAAAYKKYVSENASSFDKTLLKGAAFLLVQKKLREVAKDKGAYDRAKIKIRSQRFGFKTWFLFALSLICFLIAFAPEYLRPLVVVIQFIFN